MTNWLTQLFAPSPTDDQSETTTSTTNGSSSGSGHNPESTSSDKPKRKITAYATSSGSVYHIDHEAKLVRRVQGNWKPTLYQGPDNVWRKYEAVVRTQDGALGFIWEVSDPGASGHAHYRSTLTSPVIAELEFVEGEVFG